MEPLILRGPWRLGTYSDCLLLIVAYCLLIDSECNAMQSMFQTVVVTVVVVTVFINDDDDDDEPML